MTNHPVHIIDDDGQMSPTALIPFCQIADNNSLFLGEKLNHSDVPYCNIFMPKIVQDQLCYEVNPNNYKHFMIENEELSIQLYIDFNEDREISSNIDFVDDGLQSSPNTEIIFLGTKGENIILYVELGKTSKKNRVNSENGTFSLYTPPPPL